MDSVEPFSSYKRQTSHVNGNKISSFQSTVVKYSTLKFVLYIDSRVAKLKYLSEKGKAIFIGCRKSRDKFKPIKVHYFKVD